MGKFCDVEKFKKAYKHKIGTQFDNAINEMERERFCVDAVDREKILDFIEDNRPTDVQTDWERGCAYICDEIEKLLK